MSSDFILFVSFLTGAFIIILGILIEDLLSKYRLFQQEKKINETISQRQIENAKQTYDELKSMIGKDIDKLLEGYDFNSAVEVLNHISSMMTLSNSSTDEAIDAFNAIVTPSVETIEAQEQKEPQVIFRPKAVIMETADKKFVYPVENKSIKIIQDDIEITHNDDEIVITKNLDNWYDNFMEEIKEKEEVDLGID